MKTRTPRYEVLNQNGQSLFTDGKPRTMAQLHKAFKNDGAMYPGYFARREDGIPLSETEWFELPHNLK
jgi:hypothetical protein